MAPSRRPPRGTSPSARPTIRRPPPVPWVDEPGTLSATEKNMWRWQIVEQLELARSGCELGPGHEARDDKVDHQCHPGTCCRDPGCSELPCSRWIDPGHKARDDDNDLKRQKQTPGGPKRRQPDITSGTRPNAAPEWGR